MFENASESTIAYLKEEIRSLGRIPFDPYPIDSRVDVAGWRAAFVAKAVEVALRGTTRQYRHTLDELDREVQALEDSYREATRHLLHVRGTLAEARRQEEITM